MGRIYCRSEKAPFRELFQILTNAGGALIFAVIVVIIICAVGALIAGGVFQQEEYAHADCNGGQRHCGHKADYRGVEALICHGLRILILGRRGGGQGRGVCNRDRGGEYLLALRRAVAGPYAHIVILAAGDRVWHIGRGLRPGDGRAIGVAVSVVAIPLVVQRHSRILRVGACRDGQRRRLALRQNCAHGLRGNAGREDGGRARVAGVGARRHSGGGACPGGIGRGGLRRRRGIGSRAVCGGRGRAPRAIYADYRAGGEYARPAVCADEFALDRPLVEGGGDVAEDEGVAVSAGDAQPAEIPGGILCIDGLGRVLADDAPYAACGIVGARDKRGRAAHVDGLPGGILCDLELAIIVCHGDDVGVDDAAVLAAVRGEDADEVVDRAVINRRRVAGARRAVYRLCARAVAVHAVKPLVGQRDAVAKVGHACRHGQRPGLPAGKIEGDGLLGDGGRVHRGRGRGRGRDRDRAGVGVCRVRLAVYLDAGDAYDGIRRLAVGGGGVGEVGIRRPRDRAGGRVPLVGHGARLGRGTHGGYGEGVLLPRSERDRAGNIRRE